MAKLLLCDDEEPLCRGLARLLRSISFDVVTADGPTGLARLSEERFDIILTDLRMPGVNGFEILDAARKRSPGTPVIVMSGSAEIPDAVRAMRAGARDFLIKPFELKGLEEALASVLGAVNTPPPISDPFSWRDRFAPWLQGRDPAIVPVLTLLSQVADTRCTVLITGESGTGKELVARSILAGSPRARKPFVAVNCAAIPANLVESELFGHAKGAFTGATSARVGRFAQADGGTIFLDEVGEMELGVQAKLLRLIQDGELYPVGEEVPQRVDVRILAATNRKLENEVAAGHFRADLFWRLNVIPIEMPTLRSRISDLPALCEHFVRQANDRHHRNVTGIEPDALTVLKRHSWPGNVRELENLIERLVIMKGSGTISPSDLPVARINTPPEPLASVNSGAGYGTGGMTTALGAAMGAAGHAFGNGMGTGNGHGNGTGTGTGSTAMPELPADGTDLRAILEAVEDRMIAEALERTGGNKNRAAELLGLNRTTLVEKLRRKRVMAPSA